MYVGLKQPHGNGERYVTPARAAAKETRSTEVNSRDTTKMVEHKLVLSQLGVL